MVDPKDPFARSSFGLDPVAEAHRAVWPFTTILNNGPTANRIDIVVLGDGYTVAEQGNYAVHVDNVIGPFMAEEPLAAYIQYFNVHRVDVTSNESGVDEIDLNIFRDTALDMAYGCFNIDRLLCIHVGKAAAAAAAAPAVDQILALANSTRYGGAGYPSNNLGTLAGNNPASIEIALHEFGHSFADLADEYDYGDGATYVGPEPVEPNVSIFNASQQVAQQLKWHLWMPLPNVATYEGAMYNEFGIYRPTFDSKMRSLGPPFEEVNVEQFVISIYKTVSPIDDASPPSATPLVPWTTFFVTPMQPIDHALSIQWSIDGAPISGATGAQFNPGNYVFVPGSHTVSVTVKDMTTRVRDEAARSMWMTESRSWPICLQQLYGDLVGNGVVDVSDISCVLDGFESLASCPFADLHPCGGNGVIDVNDISAILDAFSGISACPNACP